MKAAASQGRVLGSKRQVVHIPMNSSQTARLGSWSVGLIRVPVAQTPTMNPTLIIRYRTIESLAMGIKR
jgi:hypothetical protein